MNAARRIFNFYRDGFRNMDVGKSLWLIIIIKLVIMFLVLRIFFFKLELSSYKTDKEKAAHVIENLTKND